MTADRLCAWDERPIPAVARRDAKFCSKRCRQAAHRFGAAVSLHRGDARPIRLAYADPPYPGKSRRYYAQHPDYAGEVDHAALIERLVAEFPDGWALSTSAEALQDVLGLCPPGTRVAAWHRGERPTPAYRPLNGWEPVIYRGGRAYLSPVDARRVDSLVHVSRPRRTDPRRVIGAKPARFCAWLFDLLGAQLGDEFVDLFPGSGGVARSWRDASTLQAPPVAEDLHDPSGPATRDASDAAGATRRVAS